MKHHHVNTENVRFCRSCGKHGIIDFCVNCDTNQSKDELAELKAKLAEIKKHWLAIESELPTGIEYEVKNRNKFVWAYTQLRHLLENV